VSSQIPAAIIGATGYVGGELLRLVTAHPGIVLAHAVSASRAGERVSKHFPHLAPALGEQCFAGADTWLDGVPDGSQLAVFSAAPHGAAAAMLERVLEQAAARTLDVRVVDASADFRFADQAGYEAIYGPHGAPALLAQFTSGLPEHTDAVPAGHVGNPGCFATAMLLAIVPLLASGLTTGVFSASGITGSTGSGKNPTATTHHPERHSNLFAYKPLAHRHAPEVVSVAKAATGLDARLHFVPHSGPFARGIHMTVFAETTSNVTADALRQHLAEAYADADFVDVVDGMPRLKDVVASNFARLGVAVEGRQLVVTVVIDNLVKGAAGGALQWMNLLLGMPATTGLLAPAPAWT
jgi:N-acetyl-gamma-glutamyl-phosphate reductase